MGTRRAVLEDGKVKFIELEDAVLTWEDRFKAALRDTRRAGVKVKQNVRECCRSCVSLEKLGLPDWESIPFVWTYGGQGGAYRWGADGVPHAYTERRWGPADSRVERIYFNHGGPGVEGAAILAQNLRNHGITVDWKGTEGHCVTAITPYGLEEDAKRSSEKSVRFD